MPATQPPAQGTQCVPVMSGAWVIRTQDHTVAVGFPEEVVKAWLRAGLRPNAWLLPDVRTAGGLVQWALEFPLYHALFVQGTFGRGQKIPVVGTAQDFAHLCTMLRLTLLGLTVEEMRHEGVDPSLAQMLAKEAAHVALKRPDGKVAQMEDFLEPVLFDAEGLAVLGTLRIRRHGSNTWTLGTPDEAEQTLQLEPGAHVLPPYDLNLPGAACPVSPQPLELIMLGASNGFDPTGACSNMVVQANGRCVLVDAGPYIRTTLQRAGLSPAQLGALVITHAHEDHAVGLCALLEGHQRLPLFVTCETAAILRRKLALLNPQVARPDRLFDDAFEVTPVTCGQTYTHAGLEMRFHYTVHSIPCTGVEFSAHGVDGRRRIMVVGDCDSRAHVQAAAEAGVLSQQRLAGMEDLYAWDGELLVADAGEGAIHGDPIDFAESPARQVVFVHTGQLKAADVGTVTLARAGYRYTVMAEEPRPGRLERGQAHRALVRAFPLADAGAVGVMLDAATAVNVNPGQVVVRQGAPDRALYVVLAGQLEVLQKQSGTQVAHLGCLEVGEVFGERAAVSNAPRAASVVAVAPSRLLCVPAGVFAHFSQQQQLPASLPQLWQKRVALDAVPLLLNASVSVKNALALHATWRSVDAGTTLIRQGSTSNTVFILVAGRAQVCRDDSPVMAHGTQVVLEAGSVLGETAPFLNQPRSASVVTLDECRLLAISGTHFRGVVEQCPQLFCHISGLVAQRTGITAARAAEQRVKASPEVR